MTCLAVAIVFSSLTCLSDPNLEVDIDKLNKEFMEQSEVGLIGVRVLKRRFIMCCDREFVRFL